MPKVSATAAHEVAYQDMAALLAKHSKDLSPIEMLAIAANMVGKLVAMQDQRTMTASVAMKVVAENIQVGNQQVIDQLANATAGAA